MIDWTDEAIEAAHNAYWAAEESPTEINEMRAALDAAVQAQPGIITAEEFSNSQRRAYRLGRAEALEEAAKVADDFSQTVIVQSVSEKSSEERKAYADGYWEAAEEVAAAIRALKEKKG